ncbi:uncharacterized protein LOC128387218 [Panonychus citri]|uniref:uncharacterized protein LOC128387218 n=1 Tax=Panonychus citri TaxID=50023 RepID=UPI002307AE74|nr:uncharacterized protein LOC128387218 [Panonychus citri]
MELIDLPYDCLSCIFDCFSNLKQLLDLSTVCKQWNILVKRRLKKIRHLHVEREHYLSYVPFSSDNHIYTDDVELMERVNVSQFLPNLKFLSLNPNLYGECTGKMVVNILSTTANPLVGLMCETQCCSSDEIHSKCQVNVDEIVKHCGNLKYMEILDEPFLESYFFKYKFGQSLKYFEGYITEYDIIEKDEDYDYNFEEINLLCRYLEQMPNLEVLSLNEPIIEPRLWPLPKMKLKEIRFLDIRSSSSVFQFLPFFPHLRTIRLYIREVKGKDEGFPDSHTHQNVQDVVLKIHKYQGSPVESLNLIKSIMVKFPNCKNLSIDILRRVFTITNGDLIEIIKVLPNLTLFVLTVENWEDANIIETLDKFCKSAGRRINFILRSDGQTIGARSYTRYVLNEDDASPLKIDYEFLQKCHVY